MKKHLAPLQWVLLVIAAALLAAAVFAYFGDTLSNTTDVFQVEKHKTGVGALDATPVTQTFAAQENGLSSVEVMFSNYNKKVKSGTLTLTLTDESGAVLAEQTYQAAEQKNNQFVTLPLNAAQGGSKGKRYILTATGDCTEQKGVTLRMGPLNAGVTDSVLTLADGSQDTENALYLKQVFTSAVYGWQGAYTLMLLALAVLVVIPMARKEGNAHE